MTPLEKRALARPPLSYETVESFWDGSRSGTAEQCLKALCESHERLRVELEGSEILRADVEKEFASVRVLTDEHESLIRAFYIVLQFKEIAPPLVNGNRERLLRLAEKVLSELAVDSPERTTGTSAVLPGKETGSSAD